jgi:alcohol dehydrogenase (NADP+)
MSGATPQSAQQERNVAQAKEAYTATAYAAENPTSGLAPSTIRRRIPGPKDVQIDILYCGVCHSDLHQVRNEWQNAMPTVYPCVPGHEIVGRVVKTGNAVSNFKTGDLAAVGCMVDSCRTCASCRAGEEQYCDSFPTLTYNGEDKHLGGVTYGGYSESVVVDEAFVLRVSDESDLAGTAPLLCAGITTYSPLRHWKVGKGQKIGIVGLGGLGHMGVKFANAFGAEVVLFTTSANKIADGRRLGAHEVVVSKNTAEMKKHALSFDFILDTVSAQHDLNAYLELLKRDGTLTMVGAPEKPLPIEIFGLLPKRRQIAGSSIGGTRETQEMLDFCAKHKISSDVEVIGARQINEAYERLLKSDVKYRFVIDTASLK